MERTFVTGAAGYVGRRLVRALVEGGGGVVALARGPRQDAALAGAEIVRGDLLDPASYRDALARCARVVHLAASTGKARAAEHFRTNVDGTKALLGAARAAGVRGFLHVSTIAAKFPDRRRYPYAEAKLRAEQAVRAGDVPFTIVRPAIVLGPGAAVLGGLARLAKLPVVPVFGSGAARVQPIGVDDLVADLAEILATDRFRGETLELGGPEAVGFEDLLRRIRAAGGKGRARVLHLPARPVQAMLGLVEPLLLPVLPLTAGQIWTFVSDGTAAANDFAAQRRRVQTGLDETLRGALAGA